MSKKDDIDDLLGEAKPAKKVAAKKAAAAPDTKAPAKKAAAKKEEAPAAAPAKKAAAKPAKAEAAEPKEKAKKEPVHFAPGERQALYDGVTAHFKKSKKAINSKDLAEKLGVPTRKLRPVLYAMAKKAEPIIALELTASKVLGMTVSPA